MVATAIPSYVDVDTQHCASRGPHLDEVYGHIASRNRMHGCIAKVYVVSWWYYLCITSANTYMITAQFEFDNPENGRPMVCHITPSRTYAMYLDMHHIDIARDAWREYATIFACTTAWPDMRDVYDGVHIVWVGSAAYIIAHNEAYRVADAWTSSHKLRKRVELRHIGRYNDCDEAIVRSIRDTLEEMTER